MKIVVIDADERRALTLVAWLHDGEDEVVAACTDVEQGVSAIRALQPDVVILDLSAAEPGAITIGHTGDGMPLPPALIVTGEAAAVAALPGDGADRLARPYGREQLDGAVAKAAARRGRQQIDSISRWVTLVMQKLEDRPRYSDFFPLRTGHRTQLLLVDQIVWLQSEGNYVRLYTSKRSHLVRDTLTGIYARLDPRKFVRIHRGTVVNRRAIHELHSIFQGGYTVVLKDGTKLECSRRYRGDLEAALDLAS